MHGQTIAEKILSAHVGRSVYAGELTIAAVDLVMMTDGSGPLALDLYGKMGGKSVFDSQKILMVLDHYVPCPNDKVAALQDGLRAFAAAGRCRVLDLGEGICHQLLPEQGYVHPGALIVGGDSHTTTYGALNALGTGIGSSDAAAAMITGKLWFRVPETIRIVLTGRFAPRVAAKDLALYIIGMLGADGAAYQAIEFSGPAVEALTIGARMTLCNMMVETGAKCALMPGDAITREYCGNTANFVAPDADAVYCRTLEVCLDELEPMLALPHRVDNVAPVRRCAGLPVQMGVLGTCTNGRLEDLVQALAAMGDRPVAQGFELLVVPASRQVYLEASRAGVLASFMEKGAVILPPSCGPCCGSSAGIPSSGENIVSTANRNFIGRMGNVNANIYLASPATVGACAAAGEIPGMGVQAL